MRRAFKKGFWIFINTGSKTYEFGDVIPGGWTTGDNWATIDLEGRPVDSELRPEPNAQSVTYAVASFHGHTPATYITEQVRNVGPTVPDNNADKREDATGIIYDYIAFPVGTGKIPAGHPKQSPATLWHSPDTIRSTPPWKPWVLLSCGF